MCFPFSLFFNHYQIIKRFFVQEYLVNGEPLDKQNYKCPHCEKMFVREEHLKRHIRIHTDEPIHKCEVEGCNKAYTRKERLNKHLKVIQSFSMQVFH